MFLFSKAIIERKGSKMKFIFFPILLQLTLARNISPRSCLSHIGRINLFLQSFESVLYQKPHSLKHIKSKYQHLQYFHFRVGYLLENGLISTFPFILYQNITFTQDGIYSSMFFMWNVMGYELGGIEYTWIDLCRHFVAKGKL